MKENTDYRLNCHIKWIPRTSLRMTGECGRSMVEMLGVLAVIGVISAGGLYGYTKAMERHRANELLNEANKRAVMVASQLMTGRDPSIEEFPQPSDHTFAVKGPNGTANWTNTNKQFAITISGVSEAGCNQMKDAKGDIIKGFKPDNCTDDVTVILTYNNDTSTADLPPSATFTADGWTGDKPGSDCTSDTKLGGDSSCQVCVGSSYVDSDAKCESGQICVDGICKTPTGSGTGCTRNSDCTGTIDGIDCDTKTCFCNYYDYYDDAMGSGSCTGGPNKGSGFCMEVSYQTTTVAADGIAGKLSLDKMDWFSAKNFCQAVEGSMISLSGSLCTGSGANWSCDWDTLNKSGSKLSEWWTKNLYPGNSCDAFLVDTYGPVDFGGTNHVPLVGYGGRDWDNAYVLCE